jgi:phage-related protein
MDSKTRSPYPYRWRDYRSASGRQPVAEFVRTLPIAHREAIAAAMNEVRREGLAAGRRVVGEIFEVRAQTRDAHYRILFASETRYIFLRLLIFDKNDQKTRGNVKDVAERRLWEWRTR